MDALKEIAGILSAIGARPEIITGEKIKVNAPTVDKKEDAKK